jgi:endo-1,4-beta-xylanase
MKARLVLLLLVMEVFIVGNSFAKDDVAAKVKPAAISARIEKIRMGDIVVKAKPGAEVKVEQVRHEFLFGTAVPDSLAEKDVKAMSDADRKMYLKILKENFNYAVHENALKWYDCEWTQGVVDYYRADRIWEMCNELGIPMRGHCIFWEKDDFVMDWVKKLNNDELRAAVASRAIDVTRHFKGRIEEFDLNNEMINGTFFRRRLGYGIISEMAYMAKLGNPEAVLYVNDYGVIVEKGFNAGSYIEQIEKLLENGVPIGGIGCQAHFVASKKNDSTGTAVTTNEHVQKTLDRLAKFDLPIKITECLFRADTEEGMAEELERFFPIVFAHPKVEAILMWGFWAGDHWMPETAMWKKDWTPTAQATAYRELVFGKWWTKAEGAADETGKYKIRGFYGDYVISSDGVEKKVKLSKSEKSVEVSFE